MKRKLLFALALTTFFAVESWSAKTTPLVGEWRFALDRSGIGMGEKWFAKELPDKIQLPGVLQAQGRVDEDGCRNADALQHEHLYGGSGE